MKKEEQYTLRGAEILRQTDAAMLVEVDDEEIWLPLSQVSEITTHPDGNVDVVMSAWIAKKKGLL